MGQQYSHRQGSVLSCADRQTLAIMLLLMFIICSFESQWDPLNVLQNAPHFPQTSTQREVEIW